MALFIEKISINSLFDTYQGAKGIKRLNTISKQLIFNLMLMAYNLVVFNCCGAQPVSFA